MKTILSAVSVAVLLTAHAACAAPPSKVAAAAPAGKVEPGTCPWPSNAMYRDRCAATYKAPVRSTRPVAYGTRECSWPKAAKNC